ASKATSLEKLGGIEQKIEGLESEIGRLRDKLDRLEPAEGIEAIEWNIESTEMLDARLVELEKQLTSASAAASEREKQVKIAGDSLAGHEAALSTALDGSDFGGEAALREIRIGDEGYGELSALDTRLSDEAKGLGGKIESCAELLKRLREAGVPEGDALVKVAERQETLSASLESVGEKIGSLRVELKTDDRNVETLKERGAAMAQLRDRLKLWQRLSGLVGSADGKKFRRFAQGLSLDVLLGHANAHLERLSDRYQLVRSEGEELGLEIIDRFQASVRRPMASLSGGESFLASLALALGLSDLAGRNVQIDSLFIDEGFGTLDGDTLDEAISALESLRLRDKTVGVISHVELLKERISTQVVVGRDSAGRGKIEVIG
ncbi:MAG: SbcC/MukB-like Walker B domain-containing protein, partial [Verrucomicrobiales bacterium]